MAVPNHRGAEATLVSDLRLDVAFPLSAPAAPGQPAAQVPVDHGYALYGALCQRLPVLHAAPWLAIHPLRGKPERGLLLLGEDAALHLRVPPKELRQLLPLAQQELQIQGHKLRLAEPRLQLLVPAPTVETRMAVIKGFMEESAFGEAVQRQLAALSVQAQVTVGPRRVAQIGGHKVVGFALRLSRLSADASLLLQYRGIGGRQRMGCGVFLPGASGGSPGEATCGGARGPRPLNPCRP